MVDDPSTDAFICWSPSGQSFFVPNAQKFAAIVLPRFFKHSRFSSFVRQLNMYGFHKVPHLQQGALLKDGGPFDASASASAAGSSSSAPKKASVAEEAEEEEGGQDKDKDKDDLELWEFQHDYFQKGRHDLLHLVQRKKAQPTAKSKDRRSGKTPGANDDMDEDDLMLQQYDGALTTRKDSEPWALMPFLGGNAAAGGFGSPMPASSSNAAAAPATTAPAFQQLLENLFSNPAALAAAAAAANKANGGDAQTGAGGGGTYHDGSNGNNGGGDNNNGGGAFSSNASPLHITTLWNTLQSIQRAQADITRDLHHLKSSHTALWQEALESKNRAKQQDQTMERLLRFLAGVFGAGTAGGNILESAGMGNWQQQQGLGVDEEQSAANVEELIDSFAKGGANSGARGNGDGARGGSGNAGNIHEGASVIHPRRRGLMIEGPNTYSPPSHPNPEYARTSTDDDATRFSEAVSPDTLPSVSPINESSRFTRIGSPSPSGTSSRSNAGLRPGGSATKRKSGSSKRQSSESSQASSRRLSQQQQQQLISAFSTDQGSTWLAQLLQQNNGTPASPSPFIQDGQQSPNSAPPVEKLDSSAMATLQSIFASNNATPSGYDGSSDATPQEQQLALAFPRSSLELQHSAENAAKVQDSISQLIESLKTDPNAAAVVANHQGAIANGIQTLDSHSPDPLGAAASPPSGMGTDADMDALLSQFLTSDVANTPPPTSLALERGPSADGDAAYAFSPNTTSAFFSTKHAPDKVAPVDEYSPANSDGRIKTVSPESSAGNTPATHPILLPDEQYTSGNTRISSSTKRKADGALQTANKAPRTDRRQ